MEYIKSAQMTVSLPLPGCSEWANRFPISGSQTRIDRFFLDKMKKNH